MDERYSYGQPQNAAAMIGGAGAGAFMPQTAPPQPMPNVHGAFEILAARLEETHKVVSLLEERLQPVLRPSPNAIGASNQPNEKAPVSGLANVALALAARVESTNQRIANLLNVLDL